jgi:hypothetical protein
MGNPTSFMSASAAIVVGRISRSVSRKQRGDTLSFRPALHTNNPSGGFATNCHE